MRGLAFLCLAGGGIIGWLVASTDSDGRLEQLAKVTRIMTLPPSPEQATVVPAVRTTTTAQRVFSPGSAIVAPPPEAGTYQAAAQGAVETREPGLRPLPDQIAAARSSQTTGGADDTSGERLGALRSTVDLARAIQKNLRRVGCYSGEIDGDWGPASRRAMRGFVESVNAALPVDDPDFILLTLVQGHQGAACGKRCPSGQATSEDGRCMGGATVARAEPPREPRPALEAAAVAAKAAAVAGGDIASGRAVAGPVEPRSRPQAIASLPLLEPRGPSVVPALPGRMSVGGPGAASPAAASLTGVEPPTQGAEPGTGLAQAGAEKDKKAGRTKSASRERRQREGRAERYAPPPTAYYAPRRPARAFATAQSVRDFFFNPMRN